MNEADTRAERIDPQLEAAGWKTNPELGVRVRREFTITAGELRSSGERQKALKADYVLEYKNIKLAVVEAKSDDLDVSEGVAQAKRYAEKLRLPFSFAANGRGIYEIHHAAHTEGLVDAFPTPEQLWQRTFGDINDWQKRFNAVPFESSNDRKQARYYQELAVNKAVAAIAHNQKRILLTLATGTGKTFIAFQIAWKLFKSRWNLQLDGKRQPRILFLADRNILANQAFLDFGAFDPAALVRIDPSEISKRGEVPKNASVFFTIFQTFLSGKGETPHFSHYDPDFFDLVIIDECHRGGANDESSWRGILDYFSSAVQLGLTATPKRADNADTYAYFGEPVFIYSLKEGIQDGFLTPFKVKRIQTTLDEYLYSPEDDVLEGDVESGRLYTEKDFNTIIEIEARERKRVQLLLGSIQPTEKTLVFCANQAHAARVRDLINQEAHSPNVDYCVRVTANDGALGDLYLKQFQDNDKSIPTILTTSQKLTTGVDARNVRNIVLLRPINSMIEFKQIIGRGTRLFEGKHYFTILDFVNAYHLFSDADWDGEPVELLHTTEADALTPLPPPITTPSNEEKPLPEGDGTKAPFKPKLRIQLSDGKVREIQSMSSTYFYVDGQPISAEAFLKRLFNTLNLPELLGSEQQLRTVWANPLTRRDLIEKLDRAGCHKTDLEKLQELIDAQNSDLFDVLEYIAYATPPIPRADRVAANESNIYHFLNEAQRAFVAYVLRNYVANGVDELDVAKLSKLLEAKYGSLHAAQQTLGTVSDIQGTFIAFQQQLYKETAVG